MSYIENLVLNFYLATQWFPYKSEKKFHYCFIQVSMVLSALQSFFCKKSLHVNDYIFDFNDGKAVFFCTFGLPSVITHNLFL